MSRGNGGQDIYLSPDDYWLYLETLGEACERAAYRIHAYVLMRNHYHLLLQTSNANLVEGMGWLQQTFTQRFNARHRRRGHLFQGRYKAQIIEAESSEGYFRKVGNYIHLNPARARLVGGRSRFGRLADFPWSSFPLYLDASRKRPKWLAVESLLAEHQLGDTPAGRREYARFLEALVATERAERNQDGQEYRRIRRGWYLGGESFRERVLGMAETILEGKRPESFEASALREVGEREAERLIQRCLKHLKVRPQELAGLRKTDVRKYLIAWVVKRRTSVTNRWLSQRLHMGHYTSASNAVRIIERSGDRSVKTLKRQLEKLF